MATGLVLLGGADGIFGPATASALRLYQRVNGLGVTGVVDDATARLMGLGSQPGVTPSGYPTYGERSQRVIALQLALIRAGLSFTGGADGSFGAATTGAIVRFQQIAWPAGVRKDRPGDGAGARPAGDAGSAPVDGDDPYLPVPGRRAVLVR